VVQKGEVMQKFINDLIIVGLTENEAKTYILLLEKPLTATKIAQLIGVNRSNVYGIISSLAQKGFVRKMNAAVRTIMPINPKIAFDTSKTDLQMRIKLMDKLAEELFPYFEADNQQDNKELIKILHTKSVIMDTLEKLELDAENEVLAFSKPPYIMNVDKLDDLNIVQKESAKKGVIYKAVHEIEPDNLQNFIKRMYYFESMGEEVRVAHHLPMKMFIFDRKIAVFTLENNLNNFSNFTFTSFEHTDVAITFTQIFQQYWDKAMLLDEFIKQTNKE
jgi:sugar-specific transcriptional regulator TrmB